MPKHTKPIMILGQDECIFKQYLFSKGFWTHADGTKQLIPKEEGQGLMLSCFCSRELGFGFPLSQEVLDAINKKRENESYIDEKAAIEVYGNPKKQKLTSSPFTRYMEYGSNKEGYWNYDHMIVQMDDCVQVLKHLYPQFEYVFLFDHSNSTVESNRKCVIAY